MKKTHNSSARFLILLVIALAVGILNVGCGGVTAAPSAASQTQSVSVAISPVSAALQIGGSQQFSVTVTGSSNTAVTWSATGGTISGSGLYTAPSAAGIYTVTATSVADSTKSASAAVTVTTTAPAVTLSITPASSAVQVGKTQQFSASITGSSNTSVIWSASGGTISASGLYTAPTTAGSYTVTATSVADTTVSSSATVAVTTTAPPVVVSINPTSASIQTGATQQFKATVTGTSNTAVTWTTTGGTVSSTGLYTAPGNAGSYTVSATSAADTTKKASVKVTVTAPAAAAVNISPTGVSLAPNATTTFTATVSNSSNTAVTWTATGGTISGTGNSITYTAPSSTGTYTVTVTSVADTSKQASANVNDTTSPAPSFEGYGAGATGGSNVVHVTNLNSSGSGSLAAAIASSGNHVVFDVGGTISGTFNIPSNTTIDGFSAPSPGITITGGTGSAGILTIEDVSNIIIQGIRIRGSSNIPANTKGIMFYESGNGTNHDIVIDHCEIDNVSDEDLGSMAHNVTISWNLLGAPASSGGELIKYDAYHYSIHHNLWVGFTGNDSRIPLVWAGDDSTSADTWNGQTVADVVGNVASQFLYGITYVTDGADQDHSNIMNNFLDGQDSSHARNGIDIMASPLEQHYIAGNASVINPVGSPSTYGCGASNICGTYSIITTNQLSGGQVSTPFAMPSITTSCVYDATARIAEWNNVINNSGVVTHYADDATSSALRSVVTKPTSTIMGQLWNQQTGSCQ